MAMLSKAARPVMGATAGFHTNKRRGELRDTGHHLRAIEPFADQNRAMRIHPHEVKHLFCNVDADDAKLLHGTRLLWLNDFTRLEIILGHCSRSAQGAGPFHYDPIQGSGPVTCEISRKRRKNKRVFALITLPKKICRSRNVFGTPCVLSVNGRDRNSCKRIHTKEPPQRVW